MGKHLTQLIKSYYYSTRYTMVLAKKFVLAKHFEGAPKESDLQLIEEELPPIKDGGT